MKLRAGRKDLWLCLAVVAALALMLPTDAVAATDATFGGISSDGTKAFFNSADQLTGDDTDGQVDVYRRSGTTTTRISVGAINGNLGHNASFAGASADGNRVFFTTTEQLASTDTDSSSDAYERFGSTTTQVSTGAINGNSPIAVTFEGASADGLHVFFSTTEALVAGDADGSRDIYERFNGVITRISAGAINGNGAFDAAFAGSSSDGTHVFFTTNEPLVSADTDTRRDIYERFSGGTTSRLHRIAECEYLGRCQLRQGLDQRPARVLHHCRGARDDRHRQPHRRLRPKRWRHDPGLARRDQRQWLVRRRVRRHLRRRVRRRVRDR